MTTLMRADVKPLDTSVFFGVLEGRKAGSWEEWAMLGKSSLTTPPNMDEERGKIGKGLEPPRCAKPTQEFRLISLFKKNY